MSKRKVTLGTALATAALAGAAVIMSPGNASANPICTTLYAPGGGHADICRQWWSNGAGSYDGKWYPKTPGVITSNVYLQAREDGGAPYRTSFSARFYSADKALNRLCSSLTNTCGGWW
ncbi:hypothetical protein [Streptomyces sp. SGAir0957]